jgi:hypothetical protein
MTNQKTRHQMSTAIPEGHVVVPVEPTPELLMSMAVRYDHGLGIPGYYDQEIFSKSGITHAQRLEATLRTMSQLHEEVVGTGFYRPRKPLEITDTSSDIEST